jgi:hypothetical protein
LLEVVDENTDEIITDLKTDLSELWAILDSQAEARLWNGNISRSCLAFLEHILRSFF